VRDDPPPSTVLRAFGATEQPRPLPGGQGTSWVVGDLVLKPGGGLVYEWLAEALQDVTPDGFRLATPVRATNGAWLYEGWTATLRMGGAEPTRRTASVWTEIIEVARRLHRAVAGLPRTDLLDLRRDAWAQADPVAWGERSVQFHPRLAELVRRLRPGLEPLGRSQIVHADLTGNVLFSSRESPAVIDFSPYWRPPEYAEGVVLADAMCWHGADASLMEQTNVSVPAVARALLFRIATTNEFAADGPGHVNLQHEARRYAAAIGAIGL
jgi:uncharacterized protein (TIGR02569 family)